MAKKLIRGMHHVSLKTGSKEKFIKGVKFYSGLLGMEVVRSWTGPEGPCSMIETGTGCIELSCAPAMSDETGSINHIALATDDVDECVRIVRNAGYEITKEPFDTVLKSEEPLNVRIAFCIGPVGEEIEFFCEKD